MNEPNPTSIWRLQPCAQCLLSMQTWWRSNDYSIYESPASSMCYCGMLHGENARKHGKTSWEWRNVKIIESYHAIIETSFLTEPKHNSSQHTVTHRTKIHETTLDDEEKARAFDLPAFGGGVIYGVFVFLFPIQKLGVSKVIKHIFYHHSPLSTSTFKSFGV